MIVIPLSVHEIQFGFDCPVCHAPVPPCTSRCEHCHQTFLAEPVRMQEQGRAAELEEELNEYGALPLGAPDRD